MSGAKSTTKMLQSARELHRAGQTAQAEKAYGRVLAREPNRPDAAFLLGLIALESGRLDYAIQLFERAARSDPGNAVYHANLGEALRRAGKHAPARDALLLATQLDPGLFPPAYNLGVLFQDIGESESAVGAYRRALAIDPAAAVAHGNLANTLVHLRRFDEALTCFEQAILLDPSPVLHHNFGNALARAGRIEQAIAAYRTALALKPDYPACHSDLVFIMNFLPSQTVHTLADEARAWDRLHGAPLARAAGSHHDDRTEDRRLRIGYVSPDFRDHCQAFFTFPLLSHHDHGKFEIFCYSDVGRPDELTDRLLKHADHARRIYGESDDRVAARIRDDRIDLLVDLTMHMGQNRLQVFARKPAPLQICWLAYPGTTGLSAMDYRVTDVHLEPPEGVQAPFSEKPLRLPDTFWCYDPLTTDEPVSALPALANGHIRFGSLNNFGKINPAVIETWARVLDAVAGSRLVVMVPEGSTREELVRGFEQHGIDRGRIEPVGFRPRPAYLATYRTIDVCLDTFPYGGHTTSLDALWMGVPVVTLVGPTVVGRAGLCHAMNLKLPELVAASSDEYVSIAAELCKSLTKLSALREGLRGRMQRSPLMDAPRFARHMEAAFREVWLRYCRQPRAERPLTPS